MVSIIQVHLDRNHKRAERGKYLHAHDGLLLWRFVAHDCDG